MLAVCKEAEETFLGDRSSIGFALRRRGFIARVAKRTEREARRLLSLKRDILVVWFFERLKLLGRDRNVVTVQAVVPLL